MLVYSQMATLALDRTQQCQDVEVLSGSSKWAQMLQARCPYSVAFPARSAGSWGRGRAAGIQNCSHMGCTHVRGLNPLGHSPGSWCFHCFQNALLVFYPCILGLLCLSASAKGKKFFFIILFLFDVYIVDKDAHPEGHWLGYKEWRHEGRCGGQMIPIFLFVFLVYEGNGVCVCVFQRELLSSAKFH